MNIRYSVLSGIVGCLLILAGPAFGQDSGSGVPVPGAIYQPCANSTPPAQQAPPFNVSKVIQALRSPIVLSNKQNMVLISAHRGYWKNAPENSLNAFLAAAQAGAELLEFDVRDTNVKTLNDRIPIMAHDDFLARTTNTLDPQAKVSTTSAEQYLSLYIRDRRGCVTSTHTSSFDSILRRMATYNQVYKDGSSVVRGETIIVDVKGSIAPDSGFEGFEMYQTLLDSIKVLKSVYNAYPALKGAVVFKVRLAVMPDNPSSFWNDVNTVTGDSYVPPMIFVLQPDDPKRPGRDTQPVTWEGVQRDTRFMNYFNDYVSGTSGHTLHFETNERYIYDQSYAYRGFLQNPPLGIPPFTIAAYATENFFPEGQPHSGECCSTNMTNVVTSSTPSNHYYSSPQPGCFSPTTPNACLDQRGMWDMELSTGASVFTLERVTDAISVFNYMGMRDVTKIQ